MRFLHELQLSFRFYSRAVRFVEEHNLWKIFLLPALLQLLAAVVVAVGAWKTSGYLVHWIFDRFTGAEESDAIRSILESFLLLAIRGSVLFLYLKLFRYTVLILYAPLLAHISTKIQAIANQREVKYCASRFFCDCSRGIRIAARNFLLEVLLTLGIVFLTLLAIWVAPLAPLFLLLIESYFFGYSMIDYRNEFFELSAADSRNLMAEHPGLVLGNGLMFNIILLIPLFGILVAPTMALISGGLAMNYLEKRKSLLCSSGPSTLIAAKF
jgi:CysZ protein